MKKNFTVCQFSLSVFVVVFFAQSFSYAQPDSIPGSFEFDGHIRNYEVFLPQNFQPDSPLIIVLHGYTLNISIMKDVTKMHYITDTSSIITVYPKSASISWNTGETVPPTGWAAYDFTVNDVGFISALIDTLDNQYDIDMNRIYVCGFSSGGEMTFRLVNELGHRFAAAASISGPLNEASATNHPIRPFPILQMHGTMDPYISYYNPHYNLWSVDSTLNFYVRNNNCIGTAETVPLPDIDTTDNCTVDKISYVNCSGNTQVIHYKIINGGHSWPGQTFVSPTAGNTNQDINASVEIVNFFNNYTNPLVNIAWTKDVELIHSGYLPSHSDTIFIKAFTVNPQNHAVSIKARILGESSAYIDSVILYDDGMHGDGNPNDNIWGNLKILTTFPEDKYYVDIFTNDLVEGTSQKYRKLNYFLLRKGPVVFDHYRITSTDTIPNAGDYLKFEFTLRNDGQSATINNVSSQIVCLDTFASLRITVNTAYGNISPGSSITGELIQYIKFADSTCGKTAHFAINIYSEGFNFWSDTFTVDIISGLEIEDEIMPKTYTLKQNFPNPFNPITTIEFTLPKSEFVELKVYNVLGKEVSTLVSKKMNQGIYTCTFDGTNLASGIYYYQLVAGDPSTGASRAASRGSGQRYREVKKMILIK